MLSTFRVIARLLAAATVLGALQASPVAAQTASADLEVSGDFIIPPPVPGSRQTPDMWVHVYNLGPATAGNAVLTVTSADLRLGGTDPQNLCTDGEPIVCNLGDLPSGSTLRIFLSLVSDSPYVATEVTLGVSSDAADPVPDNNSLTRGIVLDDRPRLIPSSSWFGLLSLAAGVLLLAAWRRNG